MERKYSSEIFVEQFPLVQLFLYHIVYFRELKNAYGSSQLESWFWTYTMNAHLLQAAITWCMVFGADGCNQTHWKKLSLNDCEDLQSSFRKRLQEVTGLNLASWNVYWSEMTKFRNKYVAHREIQYDKPVPDFSNAITVAFFYDRWIRETIAPDFLDFPYLEKFAAELQSAVAPLIRELLKVTKEYNQSTKQKL
jgi:hypothetical protein